MAPQELSSRAPDTQAPELPAHDCRPRASPTPPRPRPPAHHAGKAPRCPQTEHLRQQRRVCILAAGAILTVLAFDLMADQLTSAFRQGVPVSLLSRNEVLMILLGALAYFASFVKARGPPQSGVAKGHLRDVTPGPKARKVAGGPTKHDVGKTGSLAKKQHWEQCEVDARLIKAARKDNLPSDAAAISALVCACARLNNVGMSLDLFDHVLRTGVAFDSEFVTPATAGKFFKIVAQSLDDKRMQKDGIKLVRALLAHGLEPSTLIQNQLIRSWKSKLPEHVVEMFLNLREQGVHLSATAYRCVMTAHERTEPAFTLQLYDEIVERDVKIDRVAFNAVLCACSHLGMTEKALELFEQMPAHGLEPNGKTYGALIKACTDAGRAKEALHFFESMRAAGFEANCFALRDAIRCCVNLGKLEEAYELYQSMVRISTVPCCSTFNTYILEACQKSGYPSIPDRIQANTTWTGPGDAMCSEDACATAHAVDADLASQ